ncbi:UDP-N-acetylmuramoylalanyl-D-glutamate 2,6-diaminopimelate ligase [Campylobacter blaseri]|uniref:UDP-N-acetylmuramoyl-L-alanyl-D-glutamate--2,6-diaminopimelate ligase n=1 Tax=Campylobacter blaseri TaxID=2042961 RepID=A0A2P8R3U9_9BACT|nr:UDP-N-acetylmuramoyl-L-alanyl-D-glutamate--2,6-diaminopimelate ligase [Campylobacter blaseri]PSM53187.1 UDP-N-acetylmuramoyl-L-alanyl-D-glutamate--2,6-diaminopimelate ligase [Campylobacter blaseri]PSM54653.1 UDP-N-acetylmuramoyl-L-alanyl-D-glutamate--2,6-diaminopimelate ligase [Campylobacter blaseri]QKF86870.1 UDP-N-acetylmuramoylalanyl-D-glutamate 2,6-diaminopimelate ligase [Campylobacter blaseri]
MKIKLINNYITDNSNECTKNCYFLKSDFNAKYEKDALENGANIVDLNEAKNLLGVSKDIKIVGITGTNGKTTTAAAIYSTLLDLGYNVFLCGTRGAFVNEEKVDEKGLTTSSPIKILSYLDIATKNKCDFFIMEVSSHAIAQNRVEGIDFSLKIFTNLTQDHLDYHKTFSEYARVKSSFFMDDKTTKIINSDDENIKYSFKNTLTYSIKKVATYSLVAYSIKDGINAIVKTPDGEIMIDSDLVGEFNLYNLLAAFVAVKVLTKKTNEEIKKALSNFGGVEGRVEVVNENPKVIVDFAHTPDGIEKVLNALKANDMIVVFGAGGDRDRTKRPLMGAMVERFARTPIITSDNPRSEDPNLIIKDILEGFKFKEKAIIISDRKEAIKKALSLVKGKEIIVILGKGDENYQEIKGVKYPFSDKEVVKEILKEI